jgi:hypothetical protein
MRFIENDICVCVLKMKWKSDSAQGRANGWSLTWTTVIILETLFATSILLVASERVNTPADTVAAEVSDFPQV